jgi:hypothetical protein
MSWFSRPSLLLFLYGVPSLGLALASLSLYSRLASRQGCGMRILTYLFTCVVIPHGPGRTSKGKSAAGCTLLASDGYAHIPLGAAQLVCSQLHVGLPKGLAHFFTLFTLAGIFFQLSITSMLKIRILILSFGPEILYEGLYSMYPLK